MFSKRALLWFCVRFVYKALAHYLSGPSYFFEDACYYHCAPTSTRVYYWVVWFLKVLPRLPFWALICGWKEAAISLLVTLFCTNLVAFVTISLILVFVVLVLKSDREYRR